MSVSYGYTNLSSNGSLFDTIQASLAVSNSQGYQGKKVWKNDFFSRSGKSQGISVLVREI